MDITINIEGYVVLIFAVGQWKNKLYNQVLRIIKSAVEILS